MTTDRFAIRREKLLSALNGEAEAVLVTKDLNVTYLTGFTGDSSYLLLADGYTVLLSDSRYVTQIEQEAPGLEAVIRTSAKRMTAQVAETIASTSIKSIAYESHRLSVASFESLSEAVGEASPGLSWLPKTDLVEQLRMIKDEHEIAETERAIDAAQRGFLMMRSLLTPEMTEREVAFELEHAMRRFGAEGAGFAPIVAVGSQAALPHARPGNKKLKEDPLLLVDWGAETFGRYRSDQTRVLFTGTPTDKHRELYDIVLRSHMAGIDAIRPGVKASEVDRAARSVIEDAGYGPQFGHGLGHGFGLEIHEEPRMSALCDTELKPGMMLTVEPGIYLPGWGGFRIEDDILVTEEGHRNLCSLPKSLDFAIL